MLAAVEAEPEEDLEALEQLVRRHRDELSACICVFTGWSAARARFLREIARSGLETTALILSRNAEELDRELREDPPPCRCLPLEPPLVQEGLLKL